jgi:L-asparagine transporter-like permease
LSVVKIIAIIVLLLLGFHLLLYGYMKRRIAAANRTKRTGPPDPTG